jgi:hypothetical protein
MAGTAPTGFEFTRTRDAGPVHSSVGLSGSFVSPGKEAHAHFIVWPPFQWHRLTANGDIGTEIAYAHDGATPQPRILNDPRPMIPTVHGAGVVEVHAHGALSVWRLQRGAVNPGHRPRLKRRAARDDREVDSHSRDGKQRRYGHHDHEFSLERARHWSQITIIT